MSFAAVWPMTNKPERKAGGVSPLAREIYTYLESNPGAMDSLEGIAEWWLLETRMMAILEEVRNAVDELARAGLVEKSQGHAGPLYRLKPGSQG